MKQYQCTGVLVLVILVALLMPVSGQESEGGGFVSRILAVIPFVDKLIHISLFALLSLVNYLEQRGKASGRAWLMALMGFAVSTEILQKISGYRSFDVLDIVADWIGIFLGMSLGALLGRIFRKSHLE